MLVLEGDNILNVQLVSEFNPWIYDTNYDGKISLSEYLQAVNDYNYGKITKEQLDQVTVIWQGG